MTLDEDTYDDIYGDFRDTNWNQFVRLVKARIVETVCRDIVADWEADKDLNERNEYINKVIDDLAYDLRPYDEEIEDEYDDIEFFMEQNNIRRG